MSFLTQLSTIYQNQRHTLKALTHPNVPGFAFKSVRIHIDEETGSKQRESRNRQNITLLNSRHCNGHFQLRKSRIIDAFFTISCIHRSVYFLEGFTHQKSLRIRNLHGRSSAEVNIVSERVVEEFCASLVRTGCTKRALREMTSL